MAEFTSSIEAPRVVFPDTAKRPTVTFTSFRNMADNLESRDCKFVAESHPTAPGKDGNMRWSHQILCETPGRNPGYIKVGLKGDKLLEKTFGCGKPKLHYDFLQSKAKNYSSLCEDSDTQEDFARVWRFMKKALKDCVEAQHPDDTYSFHDPNGLKFDVPNHEAEKEHSPEGTVDITPKFEMDTFMASKGRLMVKFGYPWIMKQENIQNYTVGLNFSLDKSKYLTDAELIEVREKRDQLKKAKMAARKEEAEQLEKVCEAMAGEDAAHQGKRARTE